jgi:predicted ATPase
LSLAFYKTLGTTLKLEILARSREPRAAVEALEQALKVEQLRNSATGAKFRWLRHKLPCSLAEGLAAIGRAEDAMRTIEDAVADAEPIGFLWTLPELLRVKAQLFAALGRSAWREAEAYFHASLDLARGQAALAWELQTATALARFYRDQGRGEDAEATLAPTLRLFAEGFSTADLTAARELLRELDMNRSLAKGDG